MALIVSIDVELDLKSAFERFIVELQSSLKHRGLVFTPGAKGQIFEGSVLVGRVISWEAPSKVEIEWLTGETWNAKEPCKLKLEFEVEPFDEATRITVEFEGWGGLLQDKGYGLMGWFTDEVAASLLESTSPERFTNWLTDRNARKPSGYAARENYRNPIYHIPNFKVILDLLKLRNSDYLVEVGCGGGAFLFDALKSGCRAAAIDHSPEMVELAKEVNAEAVKEKRLEIFLSEAESLPFPDGKFTCAVSTGVFGFIEKPDVVLSEIYRVLAKGGRLVIFFSTDALKGTPAAPYPIASYLHFYEPPQMIELAKKAGFSEAKVENPSQYEYAKQAGVPEEALPLFADHGVAAYAGFLVATK